MSRITLGALADGATRAVKSARCTGSVNSVAGSALKPPIL
jgi:hypothetical protein